MIGYYVHHVGHGHLSRARSIAHALGEPVTVLSSLRRPAAWQGEWIELPSDEPVASETVLEPDAGGRLHWVPLGYDGLRGRMAAISAWIDRARPGALVSDVSVEVTLLARLHGVPVVGVVLPGDRDDEAHRLGFAVCSALIAAWPPSATGMVEGFGAADLARLEPVGAISQHAPVAVDADAEHRMRAESESPPTSGAGRRRVVVLAGGGGDVFDDGMLERARAETPGWEWELIGGRHGRWVEDPWPLLLEADVVVTAAGQNSLAEVAAARRPAVVLPQDRPHDEQRTTGHVLASAAWPAVVLDALPTQGWAAILDDALAQDTGLWADWNDGRGAERAASVIRRVAGSPSGAQE
ncbi:hypothetical protein [Herbiconiux liukaitaii]|uniref:hypothetical protein n=1 Tax=Herbiconiux liukaitaii TaxID=3342799 RepID=UPI0035BA6102